MLDSNYDYDFTPSSSSRLASLFDNPPNFGEGGNSSLIYTAPKQPKTKKEIEAEETPKSVQQSSSSVIIAKAVTMWKVQEGNQKVLLGRHGFAVIGNAAQNIYELIFYKEKNNILLRSKLNDSFTWHIYPDNFGVFYNNNQCHMVKFDDKNDHDSCTEILEKHSKIDRSRLQETKEPDNSDSSESTRANVLRRVKNLGQQILPGAAAKNTSTDLSDSELDDIQSRKIPPRKLKRNNQKSPENVSSSTENQLVVSPMYGGQNFVNNPVLFQMQPQYDVSSFLMMQNAELKSNLTSISNKLDSLNVGGASSVDDKKLQSKLKALELKLENVTSELDKYQKDYVDLQKKYDKIKNKEPQDEKIIKEKDATIFEQKNEILKLQKTIDDSIKNTTKVEILENEIERLKSELGEIKNKDDLSKSQIENYELELNKLRESQQENLRMYANTVKNNMNEMYQDFMAQFMDKSSYSVEEIQANIARNLKSTTYKIIENSRDIFN